jgi:hypothetical protein
MDEERIGMDVVSKCGKIGYCPVLENYNCALYLDEVNDWNEG